MKRGASDPDKDLLELVGDIYQAALEPERWPTLIARMSRAFDADLACIYTPIAQRPAQSLYITHNFSEDMEAAYAAYYHTIDAWSGTAFRQNRYIQGLVALGEDIIPQRELRRTEFHPQRTSPPFGGLVRYESDELPGRYPDVCMNYSGEPGCT